MVRPLGAWLLLLALALALAPADLRADTLLLKDGRKLEGTVVEETDTQVKFKLKTGNVAVTFKKEDVKELVKSAAPAEAPGPKVGGVSIPHADRSKPTGIAEVDEARKRAEAANERLQKLLDAMNRGHNSAGGIANAYESVRKEVEEREAKMEAAGKRVEQTAAELNAAVAQWNAEAAGGQVSAGTRTAHSRAESAHKSALAAYNKLVLDHNADIDRLKMMKDQYGSGAKDMGKNADELAAAFAEADEAWVRLCEAERRAQVVPREAGADTDAASAAVAMATEGAETRWVTAAELASERATLAGRRIEFEARVGAFDAAKRTLQVWVGDAPDPADWRTEVSVVLPPKVTPPSDGNAVFEGSIAPPPDLSIQVDRIATLK